MSGNTGRIVTITALAALAMGVGVAQAATGDSHRDIPATTHQIQTLNLNSGTATNPRYQFSRKAADHAAVMPVTSHQANVLNLRDVNSRIDERTGDEQAS